MYELVSCYVLEFCRPLMKLTQIQRNWVNLRKLSTNGRIIYPSSWATTETFPWRRTFSNHRSPVYWRSRDKWPSNSVKSWSFALQVIRTCWTARSSLSSQFRLTVCTTSGSLRESHYPMVPNDVMLIWQKTRQAISLYFIFLKTQRQVWGSVVEWY